MAEATSYTITTVDGVTHVVVPTGSDYYYWFVDGAYAGRTTSPEYWLVLGDDEEAELYCEVNDDEDWDYEANAPTAYPARRDVFWARSVDSDVDYYTVEQATTETTPAAEDWSTVAIVRTRHEWSHRLLSSRLTDLSWIWFRVTPTDLAGNDGTAKLVVARARVVRTPDTPDVTVSFNDDTQRVTFASA